MAASARLRRSSLSMPSASSPSSTFCSTVSHGNSANDWNTIATPFGGPWMASPRHFALPEDGAISPAMMRNSVDLPDPERPSRPTISPEWMVRSTFSSTSRSSPLPFGNDRQTPFRSIRVVDGLVWSSMTFAEGVERPPQQPIEQCHQDAHDGDAEHDAWKVAGLGCLCDIGTEPLRRQMGVAPACDFGNDRGIP